jgi:O-antigen ligase
LLAEYGVVGWIFLLLLLAYLGRAGWITLQNPVTPDGLIRAMALMSLLALLLVSAVGFPWRLASTGALFAVALALLAATDSRGQQSQSGESQSHDSYSHDPYSPEPQSHVLPPKRAGSVFPWFGGFYSPAFVVNSRAATAGLVVISACVLLAVFISVQAARAEFKIVRATKLALTISASRDANDPKWNGTKERIVTLLREGININPHYRKITPMVADEFARWGDWKTAIWIWQSVLVSRPHVVAMLTNIARGYSNQGDMATAFEYVERAKKIAPQASSVHSVEAVLLSQSGQDDKAKTMMRQALASGIFDLDMVNAAFNLGSRQHDWPLAIEAMTLRAKRWPKQAVQPWLRIGNIQLNELKDEAQALVAYRAAVAAAPPLYREEIRQNVPALLRGRL